MKKYALGVHHLNVAYIAGNEPSYHRQVRESIVPLLDLLYRHPNWCFSIEMSGFSIEFIATKYPMVLQRIRNLIQTNQIELISCTYSPQIWIVFPKTDMIKSIEMNLELLKKYSLTTSRIFFSQENFSGEGIKELTKWFDIAVLKDDYYFYLHDLPQDLASLPPYYKLSKMKVMIGWGHILESIASELEFGSEPNSKKKLSGTVKIIKNQNSRILKNTIETHKKQDKLSNYSGHWESIEWKWYQIGSSERFAKAHNVPDNIPACRFNPEWHFFLENHLIEHEKEGYNFTGIQEFMDDVSKASFEAKPCLNLLDGAWNMDNCMGGFIWTGYNNSQYEDALAVRNHNWRSRAQLIGLESILKKMPKEILGSFDIKNEIDKIWSYQLMAEVSDSTGWVPKSNEVFFSINQSENVLNTVSKISNYLKLATSSGMFVINTKNDELLQVNKSIYDEVIEIAPSQVFVNPPLLLGSTGNIGFYQVNENRQLIIADFTSNEERCGIKFNMEVEYLLYSPALMDEETVCYNFTDFKPEIIYLPLPNGLICIKENIYVIKHNEYMNIACCINRKTKSVSFEIRNQNQQPIHWVLTLFKGKLENAIDLAKSINIYPIVYL